MYRQHHQAQHHLFDVTCKQYHVTALNPFSNGTKNGDIDGTCKQSLNHFLVIVKAIRPYYRPQTKFREDNVFRGVCPSTGGLYPWVGLLSGRSCLSRGRGFWGGSLSGGVSVWGSLSRRGLCHGDHPVTVEERVVRNLLECILVLDILFESGSTFTSCVALCVHEEYQLLTVSFFPSFPPLYLFF